MQAKALASLLNDCHVTGMICPIKGTSLELTGEIHHDGYSGSAKRFSNAITHTCVTSSSNYGCS